MNGSKKKNEECLLDRSAGGSLSGCRHIGWSEYKYNSLFSLCISCDPAHGTEVQNQCKQQVSAVDQWASCCLRPLQRGFLAAVLRYDRCIRVSSIRSELYCSQGACLSCLCSKGRRDESGTAFRHDKRSGARTDGGGDLPEGKGQDPCRYCDGLWEMACFPGQCN